VPTAARLAWPPMFGRKRRVPRDAFDRELAERRAVEDEQPWFLADDDGPALDVEAGRSARMEDLDER